MKEPLVSVIIPAYNPPVPAFENCVASLLKQNYANFEVLIVDDGSENGVAAQMDTLCGSDPRFQVFHRPNGGVSAARNYGIEHSSGEYLTFVDADDCMAQGWLSFAVRLAKQEDSDIVYGVVQRCAQKPEEPAGDASCEYQTYADNAIWKIQEGILLCRSAAKPKGCLSINLGPYGKLFRRSCIGNIRFPEGISISEDQVFNHTVLRRCKRGVVCTKTAYYYITGNPNSVSGSWHPDAPQIMLQSLLLVQEQLIDHTQVQSAFQYRIISEMLVAIHMAFFRKDANKRGMSRRIREITKQPLVDQALREIRPFDYSLKWGSQVALLKYGCVNTFVSLKRLKQWMREWA